MRDKEAAVIDINYSGLFVSHTFYPDIPYGSECDVFETDHGTPGPTACVGLVVGD